MVGSAGFTGIKSLLSMAIFLAQVSSSRVFWNLVYLAISSSPSIFSMVSLSLRICSCSPWSHSSMGAMSMSLSIAKILSMSCSWVLSAADGGEFTPMSGQGLSLPLSSIGSI